MCDRWVWPQYTAFRCGWADRGGPRTQRSVHGKLALRAALQHRIQVGAAQGVDDAKALRVLPLDVKVWEIYGKGATLPYADLRS